MRAAIGRGQHYRADLRYSEIATASPLDHEFTRVKRPGSRIAVAAGLSGHHSRLSADDDVDSPQPTRQAVARRLLAVRLEWKAGTSSIERFGDELFRRRPNSHPVIRGNMGEAATVGSSTETIVIPRSWPRLHFAVSRRGEGGSVS
ncbi:hypothetical protein OM076_38815 [Solirubrobacter ginsenosidimutans]|uniref:Uncharacterized protein n=1 Tax=Solirubrobacter ginsenosidimutans TaxID=490573 RepID=A0A9X3N428_9ACTN|nr:hypothetical protein [Solirubrobacter ginsenosidimutans]